MKSKCTIDVLENCLSLEEATSRLMRELNNERDVYRQVHRIGTNQGFPIHRHFTTNEWLVVFDAVVDFVSQRDGVEQVQRIRSFNEAAVIYIPIGTCHTIRNRGPSITYAAIKDGPDDFNWC